MFKNLACLVFLLVLSQGLHAQCAPGQIEVRFEIQPDYYYYEPSWTIRSVPEGILLGSGTPAGTAFQVFTYCVPADGCLEFSVKDSYGDGIVPDGYFNIYVDGVLFATNDGAFGQGIIYHINCDQGEYCGDPFPAVLGEMDAPLLESWYTFAAPDTGLYRISTCFPENAGGTKIWGYETCANLIPQPNNLGAIFYADSGCNGNTAEVTAYMAGGKTYYIRIGLQQFDTAQLPIHWSMEYLGPIVGCMDPAACNYEPLATVPDTTCVYPGDPDCTDGPDLVVVQAALEASLLFSTLNNADGCAIEEGCLRGYGERKLIQFDTHIKNIGTKDYFIGPPPADPNTPSTQFVYDPCHLHWHYRGYAEYVVYDAVGGLVPIGAKNGFCVLDLECSGGGDAQYTCGNMGISVGCGDIYSRDLPCQWIDITDMAPGLYTLVVRVNWDKSPDVLGHLELNYDNNWAQVCFQVSYDANGEMQVEFVPDCPTYYDCTGAAYGDAQPDCEGVCNGTALRGDYDKDIDRDASDVEQYLEASLLEQAPTPCNELYTDADLNVYDAALLQECNLHGDDVTYWGSRFACTFPAGLLNSKDLVYLQPAALDLNAKTLDIEIVNPYNKMIGYQFQVSGLNIGSIENLAPDFNAAISFNTQNEIIALSADESTIGKNVLPGGLLRIHYTALTSDTLCIAGVTAVVNNKYELANASAAPGSCIIDQSVGAGTLPDVEAFPVLVMPNPFQQTTEMFFPGAGGEMYSVILTDMTGLELRRFDKLSGESLRIELKNEAPGVYFYQVKHPKGIASGKIIAQ